MTSTPRRDVKEVAGGLKYKENRFIVEENEVFLYYSVSTKRKTESFIQFVKRPPIVSDGILCHEGKLYSVTAKELIKGLVHVNREYLFTPGTSTGSVPGITRDQQPTLENPVSYVDQSGSLEVSEVQVDKDADVAWSQHLLELLHSEDPETEWEILEGNTQPEQLTESGTVQIANEAA